MINARKEVTLRGVMTGSGHKGGDPWDADNVLFLGFVGHFVLLQYPMDVSQFVYPFTFGRTFWLLPVPGNFEQSCY